MMVPRDTEWKITRRSPKSPGEQEQKDGDDPPRVIGGEAAEVPRGP